MKILNAYAGIGGNRKLWGENHEITAIEYDKKIATVYKDYFPGDKVIITDAHKYIEKNYKNFDLIWSSPPCPTHSIMNMTKNGLGQEMEYPDMQLYQQIIFLRKWFKGKYIVENVVPYYDPLIQPTRKLDRHYWWTNFNIDFSDIKRPFAMDTASIKDYETFLGYDLSKYKLDDKRKCLRNCVIPETGKHILDCALDIQSKKRGKQIAINFG